MNLATDCQAVFPTDMDTAADESLAQPAPSVTPMPTKRCFDIVVSAAALTFFSPGIAAIWVAVRISGRGPGLFWSKRVGRGGKVFLMPKFRSMEEGTTIVSREVLGAQACRITRLGRFLRITSLDELPQLWSVLRGHMSLVGPRALIPNDIAIPARARFPVIAAVRPGITGLAQIRGRNALPPRRKAAYDRFYALRAGLALDMFILLRTVVHVLLQKDIV